MVISNNTLEYFPREIVSFLTSLARSFEKQMVNCRISYCKYSHWTCLSLRSSFFNILIVEKICSLIFSTYYLFNYKDLLNFYKPFPWEYSLIWFSEKRIGEWSLAKKVKISVLFTRSCRIFYTKRLSNRLWLKPGEWLWWKYAA